MEICVARAEVETRWVVSAPDFTVGVGGGVHKGRNLPYRAAPARARLGTSEIVGTSFCFFCCQGI